MNTSPVSITLWLTEDQALDLLNQLEPLRRVWELNDEAEARGLSHSDQLVAAQVEEATREPVISDDAEESCPECGEARRERTCSRCGVSALLIDCGHYDQPRPIDCDFTGETLCDMCAAAVQAERRAAEEAEERLSELIMAKCRACHAPTRWVGGHWEHVTESDPRGSGTISCKDPIRTCSCGLAIILPHVEDRWHHMRTGTVSCQPVILEDGGFAEPDNYADGPCAFPVTTLRGAQ